MTPIPPAPDPHPVFREPWEASAFALAVALHAKGLYSWPEWAETLARVIARAQATGDPDTGEGYYRHWLEALETLLAAKGVTDAGELHRLEHAWAHAAARTPHGEPITLQPDDLPP